MIYRLTIIYLIKILYKLKIIIFYNINRNKFILKIDLIELS